MKVKTLKLVNFQKHADLELSFSDKVNIIHGESFSGKSCIVRALKYVLCNEGRTNDIRKEDTKVTEVTIGLDTGVTLTRMVSNSINRYILQYNGEEKTFDSFGRDIPDEIKDILKMDPIEIDGITLRPNIADQIAMPFLIDESGTTKAKLFNHLTGSDISDKIVSDINKDIHGLQRKLKTIEDTKEDKENKIAQLEVSKSDAQSRASQMESLYKKLKEKVEKYNGLNAVFLKITEVSDRINIVIDRLKGIKFRDPEKLKLISNKLDGLDKLESIKQKLIDIHSKLADSETGLNKLRCYDLDVISEKINLIVKFNEMRLKLITNADNLERTEKLKVIADEKKDAFTTKYKEYLKECGICPTCQSKISDIDLDSISL